jgi:hypothetical protein
VGEFSYNAGIGKRNLVRKWLSIIPERRVSGRAGDRQDLVILVALPRDKQNVTCVQAGKCITDSAVTVAGVSCSRRSSQNRLAYLGSRFGSGIVVGHEHDIGEFGSDAAHDGTLQSVAISSAPEQDMKF